MTWVISCQNGCDNKSTMLVQEIATGEVRALCWSCLVKISKESSDSDSLLELREEFVFWPVREDEECQ